MFRALAALALSALVFCFPAQAEQKQQVGKYAIHYAAFNSTFIPPQVAKSYGIERSRYTGLINITVLDTSAGGDEPLAVSINISGAAKNLVGSVKELDFKEIKEGTAIYYIAEVPHRNEETFTFDIAVSNGSDLTTDLSFQQKFYVD